jgi:hypothetical protein
MERAREERVKEDGGEWLHDGENEYFWSGRNKCTKQEWIKHSRVRHKQIKIFCVHAEQ